MDPKAIEQLLDARQIMLDNETMGTNADSPIIAIGAVPFTLRDGPCLSEKFYAPIKLDDVLASGAQVTGSTICWWMEQSEEARSRFFEQKQKTEAFELERALGYFSQWMDENKRLNNGNDVEIWGNGPTFDCGMLAETYRRVGMPAPWKFWNERCMRTTLRLGAAWGITKDTVKREGVHHDAVDDAIYQAQLVSLIGRHMLGVA